MNKGLLQILSLLSIIVIVFTSCLYKSPSKESLEAFVIINKGFIEQKKNLEKRNSEKRNNFLADAVINPNNEELVGLSDHAGQISNEAFELISFIKDLKIEIIMNTDGVDKKEAIRKEENPSLINKKGNFKTPSKIMAVGSEGKAKELKERIVAYRQFLLKYVEDKNFKKIESYLSILNIADITTDKWERDHFNKLPQVAILAELTRWQVIVSDAESIMLSYLSEKASSNYFRFSSLGAKIIPESNVVKAGSDFEAQIVIYAYSESVLPMITYGTSVDSLTGNVINGQILDKTNFTSDGVGHIRIPTTSVGEKKCEGIITIISPKTLKKTHYPFRTKYTVVAK